MAANGAAPPTEIDVLNCWRRLQTLYKAWERDEDLKWSQADALVVVLGKLEDTNGYRRSAAIHTWLFGYEFPETIIVFAKTKILIHTSSKKASIFDPITRAKDGVNPPFDIEILIRDPTNPSVNDQRMVDEIKQSNNGAKYGIMDPSKSKPIGTFAENWLKTLQTSGFDSVHIDAAIGELLAVKDDHEMKNVRAASSIACHLMKSLENKVETIIDDEKVVAHNELANQIERMFEDPSSISKRLNTFIVESCYPVFIQSGGEYDIRPGAVEPNESTLHFGTIIMSLGARYKSYCANIARTYFIDPDKEQEYVYKLLLDIYQLIVKLMQVGTKLNSIYGRAISLIESRKPELVEKFTKNAGFGMGIKFQESEYIINSRNDKTIQLGMVFNLSIGFQGLETQFSDPKRKTYAVLISDTVAITPEGPECLTEKISKKWTDNSFETGDAEEEPKKKVPPKKEISRASKDTKEEDIAESRFRESTVQRAEAKSKMQELEDKRKEHQKKLEEKKRKEAEDRFTKKKDKGSKEKEGTVTVHQCYGDPSQFPKELTRNKIFVDPSRETVILPIFGLMVPFHISYIKNASKTDEEYLRINFVTPEGKGAGGVQKNEVSEPNSIRIKEISYRSPDSKSLNNALRMIKEMRKRVSMRDEQKRIKDQIVVQEKLVLNKGRNPRLSDIFVRPNLTGKKTIGILEAHQNGFRFSTMKGGNIDVLYKNIKHAFYQSAENDLLVLIHFHLHNAIMIGKKKAQDVQFCTEVMEVSQALDGRYRRDENELEDEQRERAMRAKLNKEFLTFVKKVEELVGFEFDIPYSDLSFSGVPNRSAVALVPTVHCLVSLSEMPFFVMTLADVEIAYFERIQFSLKNFDLVFVFKDYDRPVIHINSISVDSLDTIKEWLDSCDIKYYEGTQNLNWSKVMTMIAANPKKFHTEQGGWSFLNPASDGDSSDSGPASSDFDPDKEDSDSGSGDAASDDYSSGGDEENEWESEEGEEEGEDWDAMEEKARREDKINHIKRGREDDYSGSEDERRGPVKKRK